MNITQKINMFLEGKDAEYDAFFAKTLKSYKVGSVNELSDADKKKFYAEIESGWNSEDEEGKDGLKEGVEEVVKASEKAGLDVTIYADNKLLSKYANGKKSRKQAEKIKDEIAKFLLAVKQDLK